MKIEQIYDDGLAHASYILHSGQEIFVIDPARDPQPYFDYANTHKGKITGIIETHPHADFVSSHLEIHNKTRATIYTSKKTNADYPHQSFDEGDIIELADVRLKALNTPGHSPDSICVLVETHDGEQKVVFTGDTLFVGDVGRPDLREDADQQQEKKEKFAGQLYHSLREKLMPLADEVTVYPAHGAGSLCGKGMSDERTSTIGKEKQNNPGLDSMSKSEFIDWLLEDQMFIPKYFSYDVELNQKGAPAFAESIDTVPKPENPQVEQLEADYLIDVRDEEQFKKGHLKGAINIMEDGKFETWLGALVPPEEAFYLIADSQAQLDSAIHKAAKIGYETNIKGAFVLRDSMPLTKSDDLELSKFKGNTRDYTIIDIRNESEVKEGKIFDHAINIPLPELQDRTDEIPVDKPIVVHCGSGYRSAAGSSIIENAIGDQTEVYDLSDAVKQFKEEEAATS